MEATGETYSPAEYERLGGMGQAKKWRKSMRVPGADGQHLGDYLAALGARKGETVVGRRAGIWWPMDESFYLGKVEGFIPTTGEHTVRYDDGDSEDLLLPMQRVKWLPAETGLAGAGALLGADAAATSAAADEVDARRAAAEEARRARRATHRGGAQGHLVPRRPVPRAHGRLRRVGVASRAVEDAPLGAAAVFRGARGTSQRARPGRRPGRRGRAPAFTHRAVREAPGTARAPGLLRADPVPGGLSEHRARAAPRARALVRQPVVLRLRGGADADQRADVQRRGVADLPGGWLFAPRVSQGYVCALPRAAPAAERRGVRVVRRARLGAAAGVGWAPRLRRRRRRRARPVRGGPPGLRASAARR